MDNKYNIGFGFAFILSILTLELLIDSLLLNENFSSLCKCNNLYAVGFYMLVAILILSCCLLMCRGFIDIRDNYANLGEIMRMLIRNTLSKNGLDLVVVVFFILHLAWIPNSIFECATDTEGIIPFWHPTIYVAGLLLVTLLMPKSKKRSGDESLVFISGISSEGKTKPVDFTVLLKPFEQHKRIKKVIIFIDPTIEILAQEGHPLFAFENYKVESDRKLLQEYLSDTLAEAIDKDNPPALELEFIECDYNILKSSYDAVNKKVEQLIPSVYEDKHLLFNLTPGTKYISIALALNSIRGGRKYCYINQTTKELETNTLDVFEMRDIFQELLN